MPDTSRTKIIHGFYRYTDIWFEWNKVLPNMTDGYAVKAILAHDAIVHPDHPLRIAGKPGIELTIGTLESGEARLMFSSAQVEYIRYWLHAMGFTKELIPLPYSDCLLTSSRLQNHAPVVYKTGGDLRNALKVFNLNLINISIRHTIPANRNQTLRDMRQMIDKNNRKLKGADSALSARRLVFERVRSLWSERRGVWCAVDFEAWDMDHHMITEFGWSAVHWVDGKPVEDMGHLIVAKHRGYTNHYVPENRRFYHFGQSEDVTMKQLKDRIHTMIQSMARPGPLFLVFHDNSQDLKYLRSPEIGAPLDGLSFILPETCAEAESFDALKIFVIDTAELFAALEGDSGGQKRSLERMCRLLQVNASLTQHLHNAGNDAQCTYLALKEMAGGDPLDTQRVTRWPQHTSNHSGLRVRFSKEDEDSDALPSDDDDDELITAGPYDPKTGRLREGWADRVARLRERLDGANVENETSEVDGRQTETEESVLN